VNSINSILLCLLALVSASCNAATDPVVADLISSFQRETVFWQQAEIGEKLASRAKLEDLAPLAPWLAHDDRHVRGNVADSAHSGAVIAVDRHHGRATRRNPARAVTSHAGPVEQFGRGRLQDVAVR
jgi:hypothetical protein